MIGNAAYPDEEAPLVQPLNDARAMAAELRARGFDVELGENLTKQGMERALERFDAKITPGATALLFYSGHGVQTGRESFLIPVNAQIWRPEDVRRDGVALEPLVAELNARGAKRKLVIVDASRRNPFERRLRGFSSGLAPIAAPEGTLVLYGVAPGKVADDTQGPNSLLVNELIGQLRASGGSAEDIFNRTRVMVARASNGEQVPAVFSALVDDFFFAPSAGPPSKASPARQSRR
ncbi:MAG: caspase family protein [Rhodoplanes sp.]